VKAVQYNCRGSEEQAHRWQRACEADNFRSVGAWLAWAADNFLKSRARAALPVPLAWSLGSFPVILDGVELQIRGWLSPPFYVFRGDARGRSYHGRHLYTLCHLSRVVATLKTFQQCKRLASEMAPVIFRDEARASALVERHVREQV
jgi:hypothetical protein